VPSDSPTDRHGVSENLYEVVFSTFNGYIRCAIVNQVTLYGSAVINVMIGVIMITRLHAMYQQSRKLLIFLAVSFVALTITNGVTVINNRHVILGEEFILSGSYLCYFPNSGPLLSSMPWILGSAWEVLALCLSAWIAVKHFRELQQRPTGVAIGDCLTVLIKSHVFYFAGFVVVDAFTLSGILSNSLAANSAIFEGVGDAASVVQMFVLGPRLILSVREYHAELVVNSDTGIRMSEIAFQADIPVSTANNSDV